MSEGILIHVSSTGYTAGMQLLTTSCHHSVFLGPAAQRLLAPACIPPTQATFSLVMPRPPSSHPSTLHNHAAGVQQRCHPLPLPLSHTCVSFPHSLTLKHPSVPMTHLLEVPLEAADQPLLWDGGLRERLIGSIAGVGHAVEAAFGGVAQDIEGVVLPDGQVVVVQSRPQVLPTINHVW